MICNKLTEVEDNTIVVGLDMCSFVICVVWDPRWIDLIFSFFNNQ